MASVNNKPESNSVKPAEKEKKWGERDNDFIFFGYNVNKTLFVVIVVVVLLLILFRKQISNAFKCSLKSTQPNKLSTIGNGNQTLTNLDVKQGRIVLDSDLYN
jgi:hypothetical protein